MRICPDAGRLHGTDVLSAEPPGYFTCFGTYSRAD